MKRRNLEFEIGETKTFYQSHHRHFVVHKKVVMALGVSICKKLMCKKPVCQKLADKKRVKQRSKISEARVETLSKILFVFW